MAEKKTTPIIIDGKDYVLEDMSDTQRTLISHISDLDRKINSTKFNLDQLSVGKDAFVNALTASLDEDPEPKEVSE